ncbi:hypothetical protein PINS_up010137 [Pythium insidiosum]|nr:hypothetical protein PINS_up010137 [Pythium insidiosum]
MCLGAGGQAIVYTFGRNDYGQLGHNDTLDRKLPQQVDALLDHRVQVVSVACGQYHTMVVTSTGRLLGFGKNDYGQLGLDTTDNQLVPVQVRGGIERQACLEVRCGYYHTIVLCAGAHLYGFGRNDYGQLGLGRASNSTAMNAQLQQQRFPLPQLIEDLEGKEIVRFACGCYHTVAVSDNGVLYVFGRNNHGQLGTGDTNERLFPYPIDDFIGKRVAMVAAGFYHTLVLTGGSDDSETMDDEERAPRDSSQQDDEQNRDEDDGRLSATSLSSMSVLSNPSIRTYLAMASQEVFAPSSSPTIFDGLEMGELRKKRSKFDEDSCNDPTVEADGEESRLEAGGSGLTKQERVPLSAAAASQHGRSLTPKTKCPPLDPLDIAAIIVAEVDRLAQPFLANKSFQCGSATKSSSRAIDILDAKEEDDDILMDHFPGAFASYVVQLSPTTFESLNALLLHLSSRRLDVTHVIAQASSTQGLQTYLTVALLRILQANIAQLSRSGICALLRELQPVQASDEAEAAAVRTMRRLQVALHSTREVLFGLVDRRLPVEGCDSVSSHRAVLMSAIDCLMTGFEIFYPCSCTRVALIDVLIRTGGGGADSPTPRMVVESTSAHGSSRMSCRACTGVWRWVPASPNTRRLLLRAVLRRMADDTIMLRLLQGFTFRVDPLVQSSPTVPPMRAIYLPLLDRLNADFIQALGDLSGCVRSIATPLSAGPVASPITLSAGSGDTIHWLLTLQKHLTAGALGSKSWIRQWSAKDANTAFVAEIEQLIEMAFHMDPTQSITDCPAALVDLIKYAHAVISQSMDVLAQALCREQLPSPTFGIASSSRMVAPPLFDWDARLLETVEHSIVGKVLPALVSCLHVFARSPVVAVALVLPMKSLLSSLDEFNRRRATVASAAKEAMERVGTTLVIDPISSSSAPPVKQPGAARRVVATASAEKNANRMSLSEALALPWSLTLEKELAMVCAEMAASLVTGDPMLHVEFDGDASPSDILPKVLFCGGLHPDAVYSSILKMPSLNRTVTHAPVDTNNPDHLFSLVLPPPPLGVIDRSCDITSVEMSTASIKLFLSAMVCCAKPSADWAFKLAVALCDWMREQFVKKDASYRLLIRQAQTKPSRQDSQTMSQETVVENAFFAALLHLEGLGLMALQLARSLDPKGSARTPPRTFLRLWRCVAELRRRIVTRRITIKNLESNPSSSSSQQINNFISRIIERCELMLLVAIDEDEEHSAYELDGGFVSPWNPASSFRSTTLTTFPKGDATSHTATRYGAMLAPFLVAFPHSRWRRVRTLFHVIIRWRRFADRNALSTPIIDAALEFVTKPDRGRHHDLQMIYTSLVDPLRRLACAARGFELLSDFLALPSLAFIQLSIVRQITDVFASRDGAKSMGVGHDHFSSFFFRELARGAHHEYLASVTSVMASTAQATLQESSDSSMTSSAKWWSVLALLRPWSQPLHPDDLEMVCDIGIVPIVLQLAEKLGGRTALDAPISLPPGDSIRSMALVSSKTTSTSSAGDEVKARHAQVLHALVRVLCLQFAFQHRSPQATTKTVPVFPVAARVFDALLGAASRLARRVSVEHSSTQEPTSDQKVSAANVSAPPRRSFELVIAPTVFSPFQRGITFRYYDMIDPPAHSTFPRQPMAPLIKPGEFTVTTWVFVDALSSDVADLDDRRIVFLRGSERELNPYLVLARDVDGHWHYEVGVAFAAGRSWVERLASKDSVRTGSWTHVAIALEGAKMRLYINGVLDSQRTMAAPLVAACAASAVSLDFHFGRLPSVENSSVSGAGRLLSTLYLRQDGEKKNSGTLRSFRGLLSHFRFHNRALSPIHVRIVFDEKKPVDEDTGAAPRAVVPSLSSDADQFLQLLATLHILSSSAEGILQMSQPKWIVHLYRVFQQCSFPSLQRTSIRLLERVLPFLEPSTVAHSLIREGLLPEPESVDAPLLLVLVLLRTIGSSMSAESASVASKHEPPLLLAESLELRNSGAMRLLDDIRRRRDRTALAIELCSLLVRLCSSSTSAWREAICHAVCRVGHEGLATTGSLGAWFILSGGTELLFEGAPVQLALTRERGVVVAIEESAPRAETTGSPPTRVFVCLDGVQGDEKCGDVDWHQSLHLECALLRSHYANLSAPSVTSPSRQFIKLSAQDIEPLAPNSLMSCEVTRKLLLESLVSAASSQLQDLQSLSTREQGNEEAQAADAADIACKELDHLQCVGFVVKALAELATTSDGAHVILEHDAIVEQLMQIATRDDTLPAFHRLDEVEKKLWAARSRLQQLIGDLGDSGVEALRDWMKMRRAAHLRCVADATDNVCGKKSLLESGPEIVEEARVSDLSRLLTLDLNLGVRSEDQEALTSSRTGIGATDSSRSARYRQSDAGIGSRMLFSGSIADDAHHGGEADDGDDDDEDDDEEEEEDADEDDDDEEEEDGDDNRQEYVDELMIMGFPEDWCVLALKQTENDIVAASAWIVDNLEYLSRMQISLDKQRDTSDNLAREDEEDDVDDAGGRDSAHEEEPSLLESMFRESQHEQDTRPAVGTIPSRAETAVPLVNDKEMARKVFGEMYFPFDEGGHLSNTKESFLTAWQVRENKIDATPRNADALPSPTLEATTAAPSVDRFQTDMETWEMEELLGVVSQLEHAFLTLSARVVLLRLLHHAHASGFAVELFAWTLSRSFTTLIKLIACRGEQFDCNGADAAPRASLRHVLSFLLRHHPSALGTMLLRFVLAELEVAATSTQYEASLWTQRELKRSDVVVLEEPGVELASWLLSVLLDIPSVASALFGANLQMDPSSHPLLQLTGMLRSSNLPLKFLVLQTISRILQLHVVAHTEAVHILLNQCHLDFASVLHASNNRFARESIQQRVLFSQYLQVFVELLLVLRRLEVDEAKRCGLDQDVLRLASPAMSKSMFTTSSHLVIPSSSDCPLHDFSLSFDRKKCRSTLLQIADDGLSVSYSGNEMWKMVLTTQSFSVGTHQWTIRVDKSTSSYLFIGVASRLANLDSFLGADEHSWGFIGDKALYYQRNRLRVYGEAFGEGDVLRVELNCEQGTLAFSKNGVPLGIAFENVVGEVFPAVAFYSRHQKVTLLSAATSLPTPAPSPTAASLLGGSVEDCLLACFMMDNIVSGAPIARDVVVAAYNMSLDWLRGGLWHVFTREERSLWVDTRREACNPFGFQANDRVRTPRGVGTVVGVADGRLWVEVDSERGAWFFHPSKLRSLALVVLTKEMSQGGNPSGSVTDNGETDGTFELTQAGTSADCGGVSLSENDFAEMLPGQSLGNWFRSCTCRSHKCTL